MTTKQTIDTQLDKVQRVPQIFTATTEINSFDAKVFLSHMEAEISVLEGLDTPNCRFALNCIRPLYREALELINGVSNGTDLELQSLIDRS